MFSIKRIIHKIKRILAMASSLDALKAKADQINTSLDKVIDTQIDMQASIATNTNTITAQTAQIVDLTNQVALLNEEKISSDDIDAVLNPVIDKINSMVPETK